METHADLYEFEDEGHGAGFTVVQNIFLTHYMPAATGNYVKVYLAGLMRCYGAKTEQWASYETIADEQQVSVDVVKRAWRYWERVGLVRRIPRYLRDTSNPYDYRTEPDTEYCHQTSNIIRFRRNLRPESEHPFVGGQNSTPPPGNIAPPRRAELPPKERQDKKTQREERQDRTKGPSRRVISQFELHMDRPPSHTERRTLTRLEGEYGTDWVDASFAEYIVQRDLQDITAPLRYIEGVLRNWSVEGMRLTDVLQHLRKLREGKT